MAATRTASLGFKVAAAVVLVAALVAAPVAVGVTVNRAGDDRLRELLLRGDALAANPAADLQQVNRYRNDVADALGESPCSPRALRIWRKALPAGWSVAEASPQSVRLATPKGRMAFECG